MSVQNKNSEKIILVYGLSGMQLMTLAMAAKKEGIGCKAVSDSETGLTISQLLSGEEQPCPDSVPLSGKYALLSGFDGQIDRALTLINQAASGVIKAVHTKNNTDWRFADLCFSIQQEQDVINKLKRKK